MTDKKSFTIQKEKSLLQINLSGGRIQELVLNTVPILGTFTRIDGKKGNTHLCVPNFGKEGTEKYNLPNHGPARKAKWQFINQTDSSLTIGYDMPKAGSYPTTLSIVQIFSLTNNTCKHEVQITNSGSKKAPVNLAIHYYWHTAQGWSNIQLNNQNVGGGSAKSSLSFKQSADAGGTALVALQVSNPAKIFQFASNNLSLTFGKTAAVNLFETP